MRMIIMFEDRTFTLEKAGPQYADQYEQRAASGATAGALAVCGGFGWIDMIKAFGSQFDKHPISKASRRKRLRSASPARY
jgi:hypothetical protein